MCHYYGLRDGFKLERMKPVPQLTSECKGWNIRAVLIDLICSSFFPAKTYLGLDYMNFIAGLTNLKHCQFTPSLHKGTVSLLFYSGTWPIQHLS